MDSVAFQTSSSWMPEGSLNVLHHNAALFVEMPFPPASRLLQSSPRLHGTLTCLRWTPCTRVMALLRTRVIQHLNIAERLKSSGRYRFTGAVSGGCERPWALIRYKLNYSPINPTTSPRKRPPRMLNKTQPFRDT